MKLSSAIFREYDIRGLVEKELNKESMLLLGKGFGTLIQEISGNNVCVGRDNRESSAELEQALIEGLLDVGCNVTDIGLATSPMVYFAVYKYKLSGGLNVTASHNPKEYNGLKLVRELGRALFGKDIQKIREIIEEGKFKVGKGKLGKREVLADYLEMLRTKIKLKRKLKVVVDCGNGTTGIVAPTIFRDWGCEVVELYCDLDGNFPNHLPDPTTPEFMRDLIEKVKEENADLGIGLDGDGDRIGVVSKNGNIIWGDRLMILFAREVLRKHRNAKILFEVKCSQGLYEEIEKNGGKPIVWKTGHSLIKEKMRTEKALLAGEMSGHMFFADEYFGFDDAVYASGRLLRILSDSKKRVGELLATAPKYFATPEMRIDCSDEDKGRVVAKVKKHFLGLYPKSITVDGIRIIFKDGWGLVRQSNTQPKIIVRVEAKSRELLHEYKKIVFDKLREFPEVKTSPI